jgi:hypothetical protein
MDYHHNRHTDYYGIEYKLYETQDNYFNQIDNDQICRNEIFEHLTLACLLDRQYLAKAPIDSDLAGLHTTLRFRRLMKNIQTGKGLEIYGVWYSPQGLMKESYFMLDGSMSHILPNDRPTVQFVKFQYSDYDDDFYDPVIQSRSSSERNFDQIITGYEYFDRGESPKIPNQWEYENSQLIIYSQIINKDYRKLAIIAGADFSPEFDYRYIKDVIKTSDYTKSIPLDNGNKYINIYAVPYRFIMEDDIASLDEWVKIHGIETFDTLAALALIHDHFIVFNWLLSNYKVDKNKLFLFLFLFAKIEFLNHYENGSSVFFDIDKLIMENRDAILNYAAASGNIVFFEHIYAEYYSRIMDALSESEKQEFLTGFWGWSYITSNYMMNKIVRTIHEGKYNGN